MLTLKKELLARLIGQCQKEFPNEACGILAGRNNIAEKVYPLTNISDNPKLCYAIDSKEQLTIFKQLRDENLEMLAIYHSHINVEAYPSKRDVDLAFYPDSSYIIVSLALLQPPVARSFKISESKISEEELVTVE
jgi:proteasome lid subunit RPN8/RPN11